MISDELRMHMSELGKKGGQAMLDKYGVEFMSKMGRLGVLARKKKRLARKATLNATKEQT